MRGDGCRAGTPGSMAWQFSIPQYWASASTSPGTRGILASISLRYGESFAPPGVTAAAHTVPCRARDALFCKPLHADRAVLGVAPVPVSGHDETRRNRLYRRRVLRRRRPSSRLPCAVRWNLSATCAGGATTCRTAGRARAVPSPRGAWQNALPAPNGTTHPRISRRPPVRPRRACPSCLWECPAVCVRGRPPLPSIRCSCGPRTCGPRHTWSSQCPDRSSCRKGCSCFGAGWIC